MGGPARICGSVAWMIIASMHYLSMAPLSAALGRPPSAVITAMGSIGKDVYCCVHLQASRVTAYICAEAPAQLLSQLYLRALVATQHFRVHFG